MTTPRSFGDLFKKTDPFGRNQGRREENRNGLIRKLKTVKDPHERDRILHALSRREEASMGNDAEPVQAAPPRQEKTSSGPAGPGLPLPVLTGTLTNLLPFAIPFLFLLMGVFYLMGALSRMHPNGSFEEVFSEIFMGLMFLGFGALGILRARKTRK